MIILDDSDEEMDEEMEQQSEAEEDGKPTVTKGKIAKLEDDSDEEMEDVAKPKPAAADAKGKGKANAEPQGISGVSGCKADGHTRQASKVGRQVLDYVEVVSMTAKKVSSCQWRSYSNDFSTDNAI